MSDERRQTCTHCCSELGGCGQHFHGLGAFDAHLQRVHEGLNRWDARTYELEHLPGQKAGLEAWTEDGWCDLGAKDQHPVTIWHLPLTEARQEQLAKMRGEGASRDTSSRSGPKESEVEE